MGRRIEGASITPPRLPLVANQPRDEGQQRPTTERDTINLHRGKKGPVDLLERSGLPAPRSGPGAGELAKQAGSALGKKLAWDAGKELTAGAAIPLKAAYDIINGLNNIGKATFEGRRISEKRAFISGLMETLHPALRDPALSPEAASRQALNSDAHRGTVDAIYAYKPGSNSTRFDHLKRRVESFEAGTRVARRILQGSTPEQRAELHRHLRNEMAHADPRYLTWSAGNEKQAMVEMLHLRVY